MQNRCLEEKERIVDPDSGSTGNIHSHLDLHGCPNGKRHTKNTKKKTTDIYFRFVSFH